MEFAVTEDLGTGYRVVRTHGELDLNDFDAYIDRRDADLGDAPVGNTLWDLRQLDAAQIATADIRSVVSITRRFFEKRAGGRSALLVEGTTDFGVGRMFEMLADSFQHNYGVFTDEAEARAWLSESNW